MHKAHLYAVVRMESSVRTCHDPKDAFTVKEVFTDPDEAESEVERLNLLSQKSNTGARYWWVTTRCKEPLLVNLLQSLDED